MPEPARFSLTDGARAAASLRRPCHASLARDRLVALLDGAAGRRIAVVGDAMLDVYLRGDVDRISPEAPVPVVRVRERRIALGGAANVAQNVVAAGRALRARVRRRRRRGAAVAARDARRRSARPTARSSTRRPPDDDEDAHRRARRSRSCASTRRRTRDLGADDVARLLAAVRDGDRTRRRAGARGLQQGRARARA